MSAEAQRQEETATNAPRRHTQMAPGPRFSTPFGAMARYRRNPLQFYLDAAQFGNVVRVQMGPWYSYFLPHPDHIQYVLQDNSQNYGRSSFVKMLKPALGESLIISDGALWRRQRRLVQPAFHRQRIAAFATIMTAAAASMLERWRLAAERGQPLDIMAEMSRLTLEVTGNALFSIDISGQANTVGQAMRCLLKHFSYRIEHFFTLPEYVPLPRNRRFWRTRRTLDQVVYGIIAERRRTGKEAEDLLTMLLHARDEDEEGMTDTQLRDEVITFLGAGTETTAVALTWTWYLLSKHPAVQQKLRAELAEVLGGRTPTAADLAQLRYTRMVIEEALRLYPPAWANSRTALNDDEIGGYYIPAKSLIAFIPYVTHRLPAYWENPEGFDPERFAPERSVGRPRYAYLPFSGGPRLCIGQEFALMEAQLVVATVAQQYRLDLVPGHPVEPHPMFTLRPRAGVVMTLHKVESTG